MEIFKVINAVHKDLAKIGIQKTDKNMFDNYDYRGIDSVYNTVSPILAHRGLLILPKVLDLNTVERTNKSGGSLFFSTIEVEFDLIAASDGSKHTIKTFGEGMDRSDKSVNKALTAAYKYALFLAFCIPVESTDADSETLLPWREVKQEESKRELKPSMKKAWENCKVAFKRDGNMDKVKERFSLTKEIEMKLVEECHELA